MKKTKPNSILDAHIEASDAEADLEVQVADILKQLGGNVYEWLLITGWHDFPCEGAAHDYREDTVRDLADALTCHCGTVAIFHQGRRLTTAEVETLEKEALGLLGPISRAKAEGKL
jgi:hypothetical protein